jgi:hypothetical protein
LSFSEFTSSEFRIESEDFADQESESSTNSLNFVEGKGNSSLSVDVGVEDTMNVLKVILSVFDDE